MQVLEHVSKETIDLLIAETGIEVDKKSTELTDEDQLLEEVSFDRYFYIYGGPEQLEVILYQFTCCTFTFISYVGIVQSDTFES